MVTLTRLLGALVAWATATPRRLIVAVAIPVFAAIVLAGPDRDGADHLLGRSASGGPQAATTSAGSPTDAGGPGAGSPAGSGGPASGASASAGASGGLPTAPVSVGPKDTPRPDPRLPGPAATVAVAYARTVDSHDARTGHDRDFLDSYRRAKPYVMAELYEKITTPRRSGDLQWTAWTAQQATVTVHVDRVAVPDGAPLPTPTTVYVRVRFTQTVTPHTGGAKPTSEPGEVTLITERQRDGRWLVSQLLVA